MTAYQHHHPYCPPPPPYLSPMCVCLHSVVLGITCCSSRTGYLCHVYLSNIPHITYVASVIYPRIVSILYIYICVCVCVCVFPSFWSDFVFFCLQQQVSCFLIASFPHTVVSGLMEDLSSLALLAEKLQVQADLPSDVAQDVSRAQAVRFLLLILSPLFCSYFILLSPPHPPPPFLHLLFSILVFIPFYSCKGQV